MISLLEDEDVGRRRVIIESVSPEIDGGRFPIKRVIGESVTVEANLFADGHSQLSAVVLHRDETTPEWSEVTLSAAANDRWRGVFVVERLGIHRYTVEGWIDPVKSWQSELQAKLRAGQDVAVDALVGAQLLEAIASRAQPRDATAPRDWSAELRSPNLSAGVWIGKWGVALGEFSVRYRDHQLATRYHRELRVIVDPLRAQFSAWYELFPRSCSPSPERPGSLKDVAAHLPRVAAMGFNVLYLPPIHPIGESARKGRNNQLARQPNDPGSPWAIGSREGGHKAVHPELGTLEDFCELVERAKASGLEIALDIALQCSPDHPYVRDHPEWFRKRPDGTIQYAQNPPKEYQDIVPFDFECAGWRSLWDELKSIFEFWIARGIRTFRVDNPHTKSLLFWEWCLAELKREQPDLIFLAEAFTRPKVMFHLAKLGFTQSYNYFAWRNRKDELIDYFTELGRAPLADYLRPNLWPNTPDILTEFLQIGGRPAFAIRLILAATLGSNYGIYGPAFEACENRPREADSEEYLNSEKYEIRRWAPDASYPLQDLIARINRIRSENPVFQSNRGLAFLPIDNDQLLAYGRSTDQGDLAIVTVVNLDPTRVQAGWLDLPQDRMRLDPNQTYQAHDLLTGARFLWRGPRNYVELDPAYSPGHVFQFRRRVRTERDFDYYV